MIFSFKHKNLYSDVGNGQCVFIPFNFNYIKIESLYIKNEAGNQFSYRIYLDLNCPFTLTQKGVYRFRIQKLRTSGNVVYHYYLLKECVQLLKEILEPILLEIIKGSGDRHADKLTTLDEIKRINSKKEDKGNDKIRYTVLHVEIDSVPQGEERNPFYFIQSPDEELLTQLSDFSEMANVIYSRKTIMEGNEAKNKVKEIFNKYDIPEDLQMQLRSAFKIDAFIDRDMKKIQVGCGGILYGPFGTGKTFIIQNPIREIFEGVLGFGYEEVNLVENVGTDDSMYWGAAMRTVNRVFMPIFKKIQTEQKPYFYFVDEGDKFAKTPSHADDDEGAAGIKNLLNPKAYPGLILCLNTNLKSSELNMALIGRRLEGVEIGYPNEETCFKMWKIYKRLVFGEDNEGNITDEQYRELAKIVAGRIGIDAIESFCSHYRTLTQSEINEDVDFIEFKNKFFRYVLKRVNDRMENDINKITSNPATNRMSDSEIESIRRDAQEQIRSITAAFSGKDSTAINSELIEKLAESGEKNLYFKNYKMFRKLLCEGGVKDAIFKYYNNKSEIDDEDISKLEECFGNIDFIIRFYEYAPSDVKNKLLPLINSINTLRNYMIHILLDLNSNRFRTEFPHLITESGKNLSSEQIVGITTYLMRELPSLE